MNMSLKFVILFEGKPDFDSLPSAATRNRRKNSSESSGDGAN